MNGSLTATFTKKEIIIDRKTIAIMGVISAVLFTWLGAYVYVPLLVTPVPLTLQTFFVLLSGAILGKRFGSLSQATYLLIGAFGAPLFCGGSYGFSYLSGPTGGYLVGFVFAAYIIGKMLKTKNSFLSVFFALVVGELIILSLGTLWLFVLMRTTLLQAVFLGTVPFIAGDVIKVVAASAIATKYLSRAKKLFY